MQFIPSHWGQPPPWLFVCVLLGGVLLRGCVWAWWAASLRAASGLEVKDGHGWSVLPASSGRWSQRREELPCPCSRTPVRSVRPGALLRRFEVVGYGCSTCVGNTGPLSEAVLSAVRQVTARRGRHTPPLPRALSFGYRRRVSVCLCFSSPCIVRLKVIRRIVFRF